MHGRVGMYGTSWSGFNSLQVASSARPRSTRSCRSTPRTTATPTTSTTWAARSRRSTSSTTSSTWRRERAAAGTRRVRDGWREEWQRRVDDAEPWLLRWLEEQVDGPYWRHGSVRPEYERITCPTMIVAGWADGYRNIAFRAFEALACPKRVILGPWATCRRRPSLPGPHIDLVPELIRWFGRWLAGRGTASTRSRRSRCSSAARRGRRRISPRCAASGGRADLAAGAAPPTVCGPRATAATASTCAATSARRPGSRAREASVGAARRPARGRRPLAHLRLAARRRARGDGAPRVRLTVTSPQPVAYLSAKLCDVFPDGTSALVSRGLLNLTHRGGHAAASRSSRACRPRSRSSSRRPRGSSSRAIASGSRSPAPTGRTSGRRRGGTLAVERATRRARAAGARRAAGRAAARRSAAASARHAADDEPTKQPPVVWRIEHDSLGRETRVVTGYGSSYDGPARRAGRGALRGLVGVSTRIPAARGRAPHDATRSPGPRRPSRPRRPRLPLRRRARTTSSSRSSPRRTGPTGSAHVERRFERAIPRRLQ